MRECLQVVVFVDGVVNPQVNQLLQGLIDEDDADQRGKCLFGEACDVADKRAGICGHQQQTEEGCPQADAGPQGEVGEAIFPDAHTKHELNGNKSHCFPIVTKPQTP